MRKYIGTILYWTGGWLLLVSILSAPLTILFAVISSGSSRLGFLVRLFAEIVGFAVGRGIFTAGRRLAQQSAGERLTTDHRPPVLLLRAFSVDGEVAERNWFMQRLLFGWMFGRASFEEQLATIIENLGPPVALGRAGEVLPEYGFAREYAENSAWRRVVDNYLSRSSWIVILLQKLTPNLIYEIQRALTSGESLKVLLVPPPLRFRTAAWQAACSSLTARLPMLPQLTDFTAAVVIDPKEGVLNVSMPASRSANAQLLAIHRALIPKYLVSEAWGLQ